MWEQDLCSCTVKEHGPGVDAVFEQALKTPNQLHRF